MEHLDQLKEAAREQVAHLLPNDIFAEFDQLNSRLLIAVTLLQRGMKELAYQLFETIAANGPDENENRHFAYVRSLAEMAEMDAEQGDFAEAEEKMATALAQFPSSMEYMMSRTHQEVYLCYYRFRLGKREQAYRELEAIVQREADRFQSHELEHGRNLVGPGLCYAVHQLALFHAEEGEWEKAVDTFRPMETYAMSVDRSQWDQALKLAEEGQFEEAFHQMEESVTYHVG